MDMKKVLKSIALDKEVSLVKVAELHGDKKQTFYNKLQRGTMRFTEYQSILDNLDCDVVVRDRVTGKIYD